jgi:hypothetical protein
VSRVPRWEVRSRGKTAAKPTKKKRKKSTVVSSKEKRTVMTHLVPNEKTQPIQWTQQPTGALVAAGSLWPLIPYM